MKDEFLEELKALINKHSKDTDANTPDFILASYLNKCLFAFSFAMYQIEQRNGLAPELWETADD